jgi:(p)ppGpp synthase/HD superfamily hydrolase
MVDHEGIAKRRIALRYWLLGRGYVRAADAMGYAEAFHSGTRKDGVTPEFAHQIAIVSYLRSMVDALRYPEETLMVGFLHDLREDYDVSDAEVLGRYGDSVANAVDAMTKVFGGVSRDPVAVFEAIGEDPMASVAKLADRINNQQSMLGVFTPEKMRSYLEETEEYFLPMLKRAKLAFCDQEPVYENLKLMLVSQNQLVRALLAANGV